jgi:hypothetical protein
VTGTAQTFTEVTLANLTRHDSGKYSCRPTEGKTDTIVVYIEDGEFPLCRHIYINIYTLIYFSIYLFIYLFAHLSYSLLQ